MLENKNCENCEHHCHCTSSGKCASCPCINCSHEKQKAQEYFDKIAE